MPKDATDPQSSVVPVGHTAFRDLTEEDQRAVEDSMLARCGISPRHRKLDFDGRFEKFERKLRLFARTMPTKSIFIGGPIGPGKTAYLSAMLRHLFRTWATQYEQPSAAAAFGFSQNVLCVDHHEFANICLDQFRDPDDRKEMHTFEDLCAVRLLLFEDLGTKKDTAFNVERLEKLVDHRWSHGLAIWLTSNVSQKDLQNKNLFPDWQRLVSRLFDQDWMAVLELPKTAPDRRGESQ